MKKLLLLLSLPTVFFLTSCNDDDDIIPAPVPPTTNRPNVNFTGLTADGRIVSYNANATETAGTALAVTGLVAGETIQAIDYRPGTGQLYAITSGSRLYIINPNTGAATAIIPLAGQMTPLLSGNVVGFDFNPTVDRIRVITSTGQNLRVNPETGAVTVDTNLSGTGTIGGAAYDANVSGATATNLYAIDFTNKTLLKSSNPNMGLYTTVGALGQTPATTAEFDINPETSFALAVFNLGATNQLYSINLSSGAATYISNISVPIIGLAIKTNPVAYAAQGTSLIIMNPAATNVTQATKPLGLPVGETVVGMDIRPATGGLYALSNTGQLYLINTSTGAATAVGTPNVLTGTAFGFDFNPQVDRIRVVSNTGQNIRINPNDGTLTMADTPLSPGAPQVSACAYTNNFAGTTSTVLFYIDSNTDMLYSSGAASPNAGVLVTVGGLGVNVDAANGFDIAGNDGKAYAALTVGGATKIYTINLTTGAATASKDLTAGVTGFTVGYGF